MTNPDTPTPTPAAPELKACPFCGAKAFISWDGDIGSPDDWSAVCDNTLDCGASVGGMVSEGAAGTAWNTRAAVAGPTEDAEVTDCSGCDHPSAFLPAVLEDREWIHRGRDNEAEPCTNTPHRCPHCGKQKASVECCYCGNHSTPPTNHQSVGERDGVTPQGQTYRDRWCEKCQVLHRYFTGRVSDTLSCKGRLATNPEHEGGTSETSGRPPRPDSSVGERCVECGHDQINDNGTCIKSVLSDDGMHVEICGHACVFQSVGERVVAEHGHYVGPELKREMASAIDTALAKQRAGFDAHVTAVSAFLSEMAEVYSLDVVLGDEMKVRDVCGQLLKLSRESREQLQNMDKQLAKQRADTWTEVIAIANEHLDGDAHFGYGLRDKLMIAAEGKR